MTTNSFVPDVVVAQPSTGYSSWSAAGSPVVYTSGPISVRNLTDTPEDCAFAGSLVVEAFRGKFIHATSERSLPKVKECTGKTHQGQRPVFYERTFVAEYNGARAGTVTVKFHGDPELQDRGEYNSLGCCDMFGLACLSLGADSENVPTGKCYLDHICVDEMFRGKGIGKVLMDVAENEARKKNCHTIYLWVKTTNRAKNLYERQGYTIQDTTSCFCCCLWCMLGVTALYRMDKRLS